VIASHQTRTKPNNRVGTKQSAIALAWGCWLWWSFAVNVTEKCGCSQSKGWD